MRPVTFVLACALVATLSSTSLARERSADDVSPLTLASARVSLDGTSNIHAYTASTTTVRVTSLEISATPDGDLLDHVLQPGGLRRFEVAIPATSLASPRDGIDKNMHKALKAQDYPEIRFRLRTLETAGDAYHAVGWLTIAGVEKDVTLNVRVERKGSSLAVSGTTDLLMTDFGVTPPKAMLGMLKTNPKVQIRLDLLFTASAA